MTQSYVHSFHIPVMGTAFTIDTPIRVARFGISSVMSIGDDELCEVMRKFHAESVGMAYEPIKKWEPDYRARRITSYLNLVHDIVQIQIERLKNEAFEPGTELTQYFELLREGTPLRSAYDQMLAEQDPNRKIKLQNELREQVVPGYLDVNIMTKIDRLNYTKYGELLPEEFSDALSALRGFAESKLEASIVFSAGFNRRLYAYVEHFADFFPDEKGHVKKKVILKVSDFRSSQTQGKFLAKKGIWVHEHRIESGLNCGGHAFATDGFLLGPILDEFRKHREQLSNELLIICNKALSDKQKVTYPNLPYTRVTVQGGIGTYSEDRFLFEHYGVDGTGWATPFLLVPEVTNLDYPTRLQLAATSRDDLYLSGISPLGVPFNTFRGSQSEQQKLARIAEGNPGSPCPKMYLVSNTEFTSKPICTASAVYQKKKIEQLKSLMLAPDVYQAEFQKVVDKACLCEDLAAGALINCNLENGRPLKSAVCPGPNLAYFSRIMTLSEMVGHIYGRWSVLNGAYRPNMFIAELKMYIDYLQNEILKVLPTPTEKQVKYLLEFKSNLVDGIVYYKGLIPQLVRETKNYQETMAEELNGLFNELETLMNKYRPELAGELPSVAAGAK